MTEEGKSDGQVQLMSCSSCLVQENNGVLKQATLCGVLPGAPRSELLSLLRSEVTAINCTTRITLLCGIIAVLCLFAVDAKASVVRDNAAASSPKTKEQSAGAAGGEVAGSTASRALPSAKPLSVFAFSWSVPGRTEDPASDSSVGSAKLDVSSEAPNVNKAPSDSTALPTAAAPQPGTHKILAQAQSASVPHHSSLAAPGIPDGGSTATPKPKQVNFFDKIFKLEKGKERSQEQTPTQKETRALDAPDGCSEVQEAARSQRTSNGIPPGKASAGLGISMSRLMTPPRNNDYSPGQTDVMVAQ